MIIKEKYLKKVLVIDWIRMSNKNVSGIANLRSCLIDSFHIMGDWLSSKSRNDQSINIGEDPYVGGSGYNKLSSDLENNLKAKGILFLAQVGLIADESKGN